MKSFQTLFFLFIFSIVSSCGSLSQKSGVEGTKDVEFQVISLEGIPTRVEKFKTTWNLKAHGPVDYRCSGNPCSDSELSKLSLDNIKSLSKTGNWKEYVDKEAPNQSDVEESKRKKINFLDREGQYASNLREGSWKFYREDLTVLRTTEYTAGKKNGLEKKYNRTGEVTEETNFVNDFKEGSYYRKTEALLTELNGEYKSDKETGNWKEFYVRDEKGNALTSASPEKDYTCVDGIKTGAFKSYSLTGSLASEGSYNNGYRQGPWKFYHPNGKIESEGTYEPITSSNSPEPCRGEAPAGVRIHKQVGAWKHYYDNGQTFATGIKDGGRIGVWTFYSNTGVLRFKGNMKNDLMMDEGEVYDATGQLQGKGKFMFTVLAIDDTTKNIKDTYKPSVPFLYYKNGKKQFEITKASDDKDPQAKEYGEDGSVIGTGPVAAGLAKKNGCWNYNGKQVYFIMDNPNPRMGAMLKCN